MEIGVKILWDISLIFWLYQHCTPALYFASERQQLNIFLSFALQHTQSLLQQRNLFASFWWQSYGGFAWVAKDPSLSLSCAGIKSRFEEPTWWQVFACFGIAWHIFEVCLWLFFCTGLKEISWLFWGLFIHFMNYFGAVLKELVKVHFGSLQDCLRDVSKTKKLTILRGD